MVYFNILSEWGLFSPVAENKLENRVIATLMHTLMKQLRLVWSWAPWAVGHLTLPYIVYFWSETIMPSDWSFRPSGVLLFTL